MWPSQSPRPEVTSSLCPEEHEREMWFSPLDAEVQEGDWPADSVLVSSLRLWDIGTSWLQIEATRRRHD